jgi:hypothetical protein
VADDDVRVPAGWYPDPLGLPQLRWWDNHAWTEHTSDARQPMVAETAQAEPLVAQPMQAQPMHASTRPEASWPRLAFADDRPFADDTIDPADFAQPVHDLVEPSTSGGPNDLPSRRTLRDAERLATDDDAGRELAGDGSLYGEPRQQLEGPTFGGQVSAEPSPAMRYAQGAGIDDAPRSIRYELDEEHEDLLGAPTIPRSAFAHATSSTATFIPDYPTETQPHLGRTHGSHSTRHADAPHTSTGAVWILTLLPVYMLLVGLVVLLSGAQGSFALVTAGLVLGVPWLAGVVLAIIDNRMLKAADMDGPASWAWSILGAPVYLVARLVATVRETGRGFGPVLTNLGLSLLMVGAVVAVPGLVMQLSPEFFSVEAERSIVADARAVGAELRVDCPEAPPLLVQQSFTCVGSNDDGEEFDILVSLQRANGWIDWRVDNWGVFTMRP